MIYFIGNEHGAIKIGYTATKSGIQGRLDNLQSANADQLTMLGHDIGTRVGEGNLHAQFAHLRIRGEWFAATNELLDYVLSLSTIDKDYVQDWIAAILPNGNTADLQRLREQARTDAVETAYAEVQDMVRIAQAKAIHIIDEAEQRYNQITDFATDCVASDIKELIVGSCSPPLSNHPCCKCGRLRHTVKEREDGLPWCNPCWVNHAIFDGGRFDAVMVQANNAAQCENAHNVM